MTELSDAMSGRDSTTLGIVAGISVLITTLLIDKAIKGATLVAVIEAAERGLADRPDMNTAQFRAVLNSMRAAATAYPDDGIPPPIG